MPCSPRQDHQLRAYRESVVVQVERAQLCEITKALWNHAMELAPLGSDNTANSEQEHSSTACIALGCRAVRAVDLWVGVRAVARHVCPAIVAGVA